MGTREILGHEDGFHEGEPVKKIKKAAHYDRFTFTEVQQRYTDLARGFMKVLAIGEGDRVLIYATTQMNWMITALACLKSGATVVTLYTTMSNEAVEQGLKESNPKIIVTESGMLKKLLDIRKKIPGLGESTKIVSLDDNFSVDESSNGSFS